MSLPLASEGAGPSHDFIAVGLDFGTTFSAVSLILSRGNRKASIKQWPSTEDGELISGPQSPTLVAVENRPEGGARSAQRRWGFQVSPDEDAFQWFKLGFVHPEYLGHGLHDSATLENARQIRRAQVMNPTDVAEAYLRGLWAHVLGQAENIVRMPLDQLVETTIHVVVSVIYF